jgi:putative chitinase
MLITEQQLKKIYPNIKKDKLELYVKAFNNVFPTYGINTPRRIAAFLGQVGVESGELRYDKELASKYNKKDVTNPYESIGTLYEGRKNLGNIQSGDGPKYIGRGILQLTGRTNYTNMSKKIGVDLVDNPELACDPEISTKIACEYFKERGLLKLADEWNLEEITRKVNGSAKLHHDLRVQYSERALKTLSPL